jgi:hypothetical protein
MNLQSALNRVASGRMQHDSLHNDPGVLVPIQSENPLHGDPIRRRQSPNQYP